MRFHEQGVGCTTRVPTFMHLNIRSYDHGVPAPPPNNQSPMVMHPRVRAGTTAIGFGERVLYPAGIDHTGEMVYILPTAAW